MNAPQPGSRADGRPAEAPDVPSGPESERPVAAQRRGRETRLLLATIAISVAVLVLLARFRFPDESGRPTPADPLPAPLERLAARATYDELATIMADLERRLLPRLLAVQIQPDRPAGSYGVAARVTPNRAVTLLAWHETLAGGAPPRILARDNARDLAVLSVPEAADMTVTLPPAPPRQGPRYVAVVEATAQGLVLRPVYVGRTDMFQDPRTTSPLLSIAAAQPALARGAAVFTLAGNFLGLAIEAGPSATVVPGDILRAAAESARTAEETRGDLGFTVEPLTRALTRATGAERGVIVNYVHPRGPALETVEQGDVVTAINGTPVTTPAGFQQVAQSRTPGSAATLAIVRRGKPLTVQVTVRDMTGDPLPPLPAEDPGFVLRAIPDLGAELVTVRPGGSAARAGLRAGDIIIRVDGRNAPTPAVLLAAYRQAQPGTALLLAVQRGADHRVFALER